MKFITSKITKILPTIALITPIFIVGCSSLNPAPENSQQVNSTTTTSDRIASDGLKQLFAGNLEGASSAFNQALKLSPNRAQYHLLNAVAYHLRGFDGDPDAYDLAEEGYRLSIQFDATVPLTHYLLGRLYLEKNKFDLARAEFSEVLLLDNKHLDAMRGMAYACYRTKDTLNAAAMIDQLEQRGAITSTADLQTAALIKAAVGQHQAAELYYQKLKLKTNNDTTRLNNVQNRLDDWLNLHNHSPELGKLIKADFTNDASAADPNVMPPMETAPAPMPSASIEPAMIEDLKIGRMVVVDVVIVASEETINSSRGVNLLNGLKIQFGATYTPPGSSMAITNPAYGYIQYHDPNFLTSMGTTINLESDTTIRAVTIPAISYTLNIVNSNSQRNEILARPTIIAQEGLPTEFFSGVGLDAAAAGTNGSSNVSVTPVEIHKEIGVRLKVTPTFIEDGRIKLEILAERTFLKTPNPDVNFTYKIETTKTTVNANVVMRYGETLILSGLSEKEAENARDGVPGLEDVPILQYGFSNKRTKDFQKSVLVLITPRRPQYVYQPEKARLAYEQSLPVDERPIANLRARYSDWFKPYPNWASVFHHMQQNSLYREFRTSDVELEQWNNLQTLGLRLKDALRNLWY